MANTQYKNGFPDLDHAKLLFEVKMDEDKGDTGTFSGFASTSDLDRGGDIIVKGAFARTLGERGADVKILWQHDMSKPIGKPTKLEEREGGLYIEGKISDTALGREAMTLLKDGVINAMSIGYSVKEADYNDHGVRVIEDLDLYEVSLVTFPMNEKARITGVKEDLLTPRKVEEVLREAGYSRSQAKAIANAGVKSLREVDSKQDSQAYDELKSMLAELNQKLKGV
jgi:HK97 family phage prohead protease